MLSTLFEPINKYDSVYHRVDNSKGVVMLHHGGFAGPGKHGYMWARFFNKHGYDTFVVHSYPPPHGTYRGAMRRNAGWKQEDCVDAMKILHRLRPDDRPNIFFIGFSNGCTAFAPFVEEGHYMDVGFMGEWNVKAAAMFYPWEWMRIQQQKSALSVPTYMVLAKNDVTHQAWLEDDWIVSNRSSGMLKVDSYPVSHAFDNPDMLEKKCRIAQYNNHIYCMEYDQKHHELVQSNVVEFFDSQLL